jgi:hypothetical protein
MISRLVSSIDVIWQIPAHFTPAIPTTTGPLKPAIPASPHRATWSRGRAKGESCLRRRVHPAAVNHALGFVECVLLAMARPRRNR